MTEGYIYCFSNPSMPGILKIGMTERTPELRLREANVSDTWRPPTPYNIELAKKVSNVSEKEKTLHTLLEQYTDRIHPRREFFRISVEEIYKFFELMDGEIWTENSDIEEDEEEKESSSSDNISSVIGCRDMSKCFKNGQRISHTIGINKTWIGTYDSSKNGIVFEGKILTLNKFAKSHYKSEKPDRNPNVNAWKECKCEVDGKWISTYCLPG